MGKVLGKYSWLYAMVCAFVVVGAHADPAIILNVSNNSDVASLINPGAEYQVWVGNTTETVNWNNLVSKTSDAAKFTFDPILVFLLFASCK